jgi:protein TonB
MLSKEIKLDSQAWCEMVFEGKNKNYGAYEIRTSSSQRHIRAFMLVLAAAVVALTMPSVILKVRDTFSPDTTLGGVEVPIELKKFKEDEKIEPLVKNPEVVEPALEKKNTIKYVAPVITDASQITDENAMQSVDVVLADKSQVSVATVTDGTDSPLSRDVNTTVEAITDDVAPEIHYVTDQPALFKGGISDMYAYISKNLRYPPIAVDNEVFGTAVVRFVVNADGSISNVEILKGFDRACDNEAMRVIKSMPAWQAGRVNGHPVRSYFTIPIKFILSK